ncbi:DUF4148 domain-containing protein [Roseateles sp. LYH14W]|uniref:DUF4148 domain-containing protein n=1 Tax=Pelomonas parva TaxID=3299032 RepID=A0ABW7F5Y9_9BURK
MNKLSTLIATVALVAAGAASAQSTAPLTREAVIAELVAARNSGELAAIHGEVGVEVTTSASAKAATVATSTLPRQAVLKDRTTEARRIDQVVADQGENAARELGDFPAPVVRRATALAGR